MNTTSLELTENKNSSGNISVITIPAEDDNDISEKSKKSWLSRLIAFSKHYINFLKLVFKSIIPDLKSFKYWQVIILILYATFNVVFTILVNPLFFSLLKKSLFSYQRILIHYFDQNKNVLY